MVRTIAVGTMLYAATSGGCGSAPNAVWAIDLDSDAKAVTSWNTNGENVVGAIAFTSDGTLIAAIGAGRFGDGKSNAMVALDPRTLQLKDWFTHGTAEFVTGPTILRRGDREIVAAATKDGRVVLLNADSLGGPDRRHTTRLVTIVAGPWGESADALAAWQHSDATLEPNPATGTTSWILLPIAGRVSAGMPAANGPCRTACCRGAEAGRRHRRHALLLGAGVEQLHRPGHTDHRQRRRVRSRPVYPRLGQLAAVRPSSTPTTESRDAGSGTAGTP